MSEPNYHTTIFFSDNLSPIETKKKQILVYKPAYLGLSILEMSKMVMYEFWYDCVKNIYIY